MDRVGLEVYRTNQESGDILKRKRKVPVLSDSQLNEVGQTISALEGVRNAKAVQEGGSVFISVWPRRGAWKAKERAKEKARSILPGELELIVALSPRDDHLCPADVLPAGCNTFVKNVDVRMTPRRQGKNNRPRPDYKRHKQSLALVD